MTKGGENSDNPRVIELRETIAEAQGLKSKLKEEINAFNNKYGSYEAFVLNPALTEEGYDSFYSALRSSIQRIQDLDTEAQRVSELQSRERQLSASIADAFTMLVDSEEYPSLSKEEKSLINELRGNNDSTINYDAYTKLAERFPVIKDIIAYKMQRRAVTDELNHLSVSDIISEKKAAVENILNAIKSLYQHLKEGNIVSEDDFMLRQTLSTLADIFLQNFNNPIFWEDAFTKVSENFSEADAANLDKYKGEFKQKVSDFFTELKNRHLSEAISKYKALVTRAQEIFTKEGIKEDSKAFVDNLLKELTYGQDIPAYLNEISELKKDLLDFSIIDLVRGAELNIDGVTLNAIKELEKEQEQFYSFKDANSYTIENAKTKKLLETLPSLLNITTSLMNFSYSGFGKTVNDFRQKAGKGRLLDDISENTKNIVQADFRYLWQKTGYLLDLQAANSKRKKEFHRNSELVTKSGFLRNIFLGKDANDSYVAKFKDAGIDLEALWKEACGGNYIDPMSVPTIENFKTYNEAFIKFQQNLHDAFNKVFDSSQAKGEFLKTLLHPEAYKLIAGDITDQHGTVMTDYSTVMFFASIAALDPMKFYGALKAIEFAEGNKFIPIIGQE